MNNYFRSKLINIGQTAREDGKTQNRVDHNLSGPLAQSQHAPQY